MSRRDGIASCLYAVFSFLGIVILAVLAVLLTSCRSVKEIPVKETEYKYIDRYIDKIKVDSIYQRDSIFIREKGDTIYEYKDKIIIKYQYLSDTIYICKVDSISVPQIIEVEKQLSRWEEAKMKVGGFAIPVIFILLFIVVGWIIRKATSLKS